MKKISLTLLLFLISCPCRADSPLTSTDFYKAYESHRMVAVAKQGTLTDAIAGFLSDAGSPIDVKSAVVNALGWNIEGKNNAALYFKYLTRSKKVSSEKLSLKELTADETFCLGYLLALDDYFTLKPLNKKGSALEQMTPEELLQEAVKRNPGSFTVRVVQALVTAQKKMDSDWCDVWKSLEAVESSEVKIDMKFQAFKIILDYMLLYEDDCKK